MTEEEQRLVKFVEQAAGVTVTGLRKQARWRPAWFIDAQRDG